ncbi:shikimate kinase [Aerococcaceae bacterium WGS1372]
MILIGFMGAGKTTIGKNLSDTLKKPFYDLDYEIIKEINMPISEYFSTFGEQMFRDIEVKYLSKYSIVPAIISTGGGCIETKTNRELLSNRNDVIYLKADFDVLFDRIQNDPINLRPTAKNKSFKELEAVYTKRAQYYEQCSDYMINTSNKSIDDIIKEIIIHFSFDDKRNQIIKDRSILY